MIRIEMNYSAIGDSDWNQFILGYDENRHRINSTENKDLNDDMICVIFDLYASAWNLMFSNSYHPYGDSAPLFMYGSTIDFRSDRDHILIEFLDKDKVKVECNGESIVCNDEGMFIPDETQSNVAINIKMMLALKSKFLYKYLKTGLIFCFINDKSWIHCIGDDAIIDERFDSVENHILKPTPELVPLVTSEKTDVIFLSEMTSSAYMLFNRRVSHIFNSEVNHKYFAEPHTLVWINFPNAVTDDSI